MPPRRDYTIADLARSTARTLHRPAGAQGQAKSSVARGHALMFMRQGTRMMSEYSNLKTGKTIIRAKKSTIEWVIAEDEHRWYTAQMTPSALPKPTQHWVRRWWLAITTALLVLFVLAGALWYQAQVGLSHIEEELKDAAVADQWRAQRDGRTQVKPLGILRDTLRKRTAAERFPTLI